MRLEVMGMILLSMIVGYPGTSVTVCQNDSNNLVLNAVVDNCYVSPEYLWQISIDNGLTWNDIAGATSTTYTRIPTVAGTYLYRLLMAQAGNINSTCRTASNPLTIIVITAPTLVLTSPLGACSSIDLTAAAVTAGSTTGLTYSYYKNAAATIPLTTPSAVATSGTYYIVGTTASGCSDTASVSITVNPKPTVVTTSPSEVCSPATVDLTAAALTAGSTTGLTYSYYSNAAGTIPLTTPSAVTTSGTYYIVGTTATGCSDTASVTVTIHSKPTVIVTTPSPVCSSATVDLTAAVVTAGSTTGLTYSYYSNAIATIPLTTPSALTTSGTYYIVGTTASGCSDTASVTVTIHSKPTVLITTPSPVCSPAMVDITAAMITSGSTAGLNYTYYSNATATIPLITPSAITTSGTYYIVGTTATGCSDTASVTITIHSKPTVLITPPSPVCSPATVDLTAAAVTSGSTAGLNYTYYSNAAATIPLTTPSAVTTSGNYYIVGTTAGGCTDTASVSITVHSKPTVVTASPSPVCSPTTIDLTAGSVTVGSTAGLNYTYYSNAAATIPLTTPSVVVTSGTYYIVGTTASNCSDTTSVSIAVNPKPTVVITNPSPVCSPATVDLTAASVTVGSTAGLTYSYYKNAAATIPLATPSAVAISGTYYMVGTTATGCSDTASISITVNPKPTIVATSPSEVCSPATIDLTAGSVTVGSTAGLNYTYYSNAAATILLTTPSAITTSGTYYIVGTTATGCSDTASVSITVNPKPTVTITTPSQVCSPATVDLTAGSVTVGSTAGLNYTYYSNAAATIPLATPSTITTSGTYYIVGTTAAGCSDTASVSIAVNPKPTVVTTSPAQVCSPTTVDLTAASVTVGSTAGLTYSYYKNAAATIPLTTPSAVTTSGTYYIVGTTATGCSDTASVSITIDPKPTVVTTSPSEVCSPATVDLTAAAVTAGSTTGLTDSYYSNAAATIALTTPSAVVTSGTYYIVGTTATGCSDTASVTVTIHSKPTVIVTTPSPVCSPAMVDLTAGPVTVGSTTGLNYTYYSNAAATIPLTTPSAVTTSGTYYIVGAIATSCSDTASVSITVNPKPTVVTTTPVEVCSPTTVDLTLTTTGSTTGLNYTYYSNAAATIPLTTPSAITTSGTYYIVGTTPDNCSDTSAVMATIIEPPLIILADTLITIDEGYSAYLSGNILPTSTGFTYSWSPDYNISSIDTSYATVNPLVDTAYTLTVNSTTIAGCNAIATVHVIVLNPISIPNIFSPNKDGIHDSWYIKNLEQYPSAEVDVFNRWGEFLYQSQGNYLEHPWDGTYNGQPLPVAAYYYIIKLNSGTSVDEKPLTGCVSIVR